MTLTETNERIAGWNLAQTGKLEPTGGTIEGDVDELNRRLEAQRG